MAAGGCPPPLPHGSTYFVGAPANVDNIEHTLAAARGRGGSASGGIGEVVGSMT